MPALPAALRSRDFRIYVAGSFFALNAMWVQRLLISWLAWDLTGSSAWVGAAAFLTFAPTMFAGPFFGVIADRVDVRRAAVGTQSAFAAIAALLLALLLADALAPWVLAGVAFIFGLVSSAHHPVRLSLAPRLVPREMLSSAVPISSINFNLARILGPAIGGVLIAAYGPAAAAAFSLAAMAPILIALRFVTPRARAQTGAARPGMLRELAEGAAMVARDPVIRRSIAVTGLFAVAGRGALEVLPSIADGAFARGATGLGHMAAAAGAGALIAALILAFGAAAPRASAVPRHSVIAAFAGLALIALLGLTDHWSLALLAVAGAGFCGTLVGVGFQSTIQIALDDEHRGRVMSLWIVVGIGAAALGALAIGACFDAFGVGPTLVGAAIASALAIAALLALDRD